MREQKRKESAPSGHDPAGAAWRDELLANAFELWLGISRLLTVVQSGPPQTSPPKRRARRQPRRDR
jgi:hypothetical protein